MNRLGAWDRMAGDVRSTWVCSHEYKVIPARVGVCFSPFTFSSQGAGTEEVESQLNGVKKTEKKNT